MTAIESELRYIVSERFDGKLEPGSHPCGKIGCVFEAASVQKNIPWTDNPEKLRCFDIRPINDIKVSSALRLEWMPRVYAAYAGSLDWPAKKQKTIVEKIIILTLRRIVSRLPGLPAEVAQRCRTVKNIADVRAVALETMEAAKAAWEAKARAAQVEKVAEKAACEAVAVAAKAVAQAAEVAARLAVAVAEVADEEVVWWTAKLAKTLAKASMVAAAATAKEEIFVAACQLWLEAAEAA